MFIKLLKSLIYFVSVFVLILVSVVIFISNFNWNNARPYLNQRITKNIGHDFAIRGDLTLQLCTESTRGSVWERYFSQTPMLCVSANDISISNVPWSNTGTQLAAVRRVMVSLQLWPLLHKKAVITQLELDMPQLALERGPDGRVNWSLPESDSSDWTMTIAQLRFPNGSMRFLDKAINLDLHAEARAVATVPAQENGKDSPDQPAQQFFLRFLLSGSYDHAPITGNGQLGSILSIKDAHTIFPVAATMQIGGNHIAFNGVITDPRAPSGINVELALAGASLSELYPLTGILLPVTGAYKIKGQLLGQKIGANWNWRYQNFMGMMGASDLAGSLDYINGAPRPTLRGTVTSNQLRLDDLGPLIGAESSTLKIARSKKTIPKNHKILPTVQFQPNQWTALDADVKFSSKHLTRTHDIPLENIVTEIHLLDGVLSLSPLYFGIAGGDVTSNISLDGRTTPIAAQIKIAGRNVMLRELFPKLESTHESLGEINGDAALTGHGNSISSMLATANGELAATVSRGSVSRYMLELAGLNVANALFVKIFGDTQVRINCLVSDFGVKDGVAEIRRFVIDTDVAVVDLKGDIDLAKEQLNLNMTPTSKGMRVFSLHSPLYAKGTFSNPDIGPYKGPLLMRATAAAALTALAPPAAILATLNIGTAPKINCPVELARMYKARSNSRSTATNAPATPVDLNEIQTNRKAMRTK